MLYYCNMVRWAWLDWGVWMTNHPPSVLWHCCLGHQTCKNRRLYNLYCVGADIKQCWINKSIVIMLSFAFLVMLFFDFTPPRASPCSLLLLSKAGEVLGLTPSDWGLDTAKVPSAYSYSCRPSFWQLPWGSWSGVGTIFQRKEDFADY